MSLDAVVVRSVATDEPKTLNVFLKERNAMHLPEFMLTIKNASYIPEAGDFLWGGSGLEGHPSVECVSDKGTFNYAREGYTKLVEVA